MATFNELLLHPNLVEEFGQQALLNDILAKYPYFDLAKYLAVKCGMIPLNEISDTLSTMPYPYMLLEEQPHIGQIRGNLTAIDISQPDIDNNDLCAPFLEVDKSLISETFANILASQGEKERAKEIYMQLSLKNPEKSSYFASLMEQLQ